jgi:Domain of unknown function (DUF6894)
MRSKRVHGSLRRWEDQGGAPLAERRSLAKPFSPSLIDATALYYFNIRNSAGVVDMDSEGVTLPDLTAALHEALALARQSLLEGDRLGKDRRHWQVEIMDRDSQHLLTVKFSEVATSELPPRPE